MNNVFDNVHLGKGAQNFQTIVVRLLFTLTLCVLGRKWSLVMTSYLDHWYYYEPSICRFLQCSCFQFGSIVAQ